MIPIDTRIAIVGATGAVGREALAILASHGHPAANILALASPRSEGARLPYLDEHLTVRALAEGSFEGVDLALFCSTGAVAREHAPRAIAAGAIVVDNSSAFRLDPAVPLVIPEVNPHALTPGARLIANPNCSTIILLMALTPLRRAFGVERIDVSTYQAVSGAGAGGIEELLAQTRATLSGEPAEPRVFHEPCAFNVFSHDSAVDAASGVNGEERKVIDETRRIWDDALLPVSPTCVRVPSLRAHAEAIAVTLGAPATESQVRACFAAAPGVAVLDDRARNAFPTPLGATGRDEVFLGRIRPDPGEARDALQRSRRWLLFVCADQLRKGAALNAIQIAALALSRPRPAVSRKGRPTGVTPVRGRAS